MMARTCVAFMVFNVVLLLACALWSLAGAPTPARRAAAESWPNALTVIIWSAAGLLINVLGSRRIWPLTPKAAYITAPVILTGMVVWTLGASYRHVVAIVIELYGGAATFPGSALAWQLTMWINWLSGAAIMAATPIAMLREQRFRRMHETEAPRT